MEAFALLFLGGVWGGWMFRRFLRTRAKERAEHVHVYREQLRWCGRDLMYIEQVHACACGKVREDQ